MEENASIKWFLEGILVVYKREGNGYWCMDIVISGSMIIKEKSFIVAFRGRGKSGMEVSVFFGGIGYVTCWQRSFLWKTFQWFIREIWRGVQWLSDTDQLLVCGRSGDIVTCTAHASAFPPHVYLHPPAYISLYI